MGHLMLATFLAIIGVVFAVIVSAAGKLVADDFKAWIPWLTSRLINCAVAKLPEAQRARYAEEWRAHVNDVPGDLSKLFVALSLLPAAGTMSRGKRLTTHIARATLALAWICLILPLLATLALTIKLSNPRLSVTTRNDRGLTEFRTTGPEGQRTKMGFILWIMWLDELPRLFDVLRGDAELPRALHLRHLFGFKERP
jgi:hypothetical protein